MSTNKKILAVTFILFLIFPAFSFSKKDLLRAVQANDDSQVKKILSMNSNLATASFDSDKNSILMLALENNPSDKLIEMLLRAGCSPDIKNKKGQTALMIACKNNCEPKMIEKIINFNAFTKIGKTHRILQKDQNGKCSFDYTNESTDAYKTLTHFTADPSKAPLVVGDITSDEQEAEPAEKPAKKNKKEKKSKKNRKEEIAEQPAELEPEEVKEDAKPLEQPVKVAEEEPVSEPVVTEQPVEPQPVIAAATVTAVTAAAVVSNETQTEEIPPEEPAQISEEITVQPAEETVQLPEPEVEPEIEQEPIVEQTAVAIEEPQKIETSHSIEYDETVNVPKIDYYNKNRPEYLFEEVDTEVTEVEEKTFKKIQNPNAADNAGRTRLMNAIMNDDVNLCYDLLESGARVDIRDKDGYTALMYACRYAKTPDIIELLFNYGAKINDKSTFNLSVLEITAAYCESKSILTIILNNAKTENLSLTESFITALKTERPEEIIRQFIKFIPNINKTVDGKTPLMYAAENYESTNVIRLLLENGADPYIISAERKNAFSYAKENSKIAHDSIYWSLNVSSARKR